MNQSTANAFINQLLVYTLVMLCFTGSIGFGTVWMRHQMSVVANDTKVLEARATEAQRHIDELTAEIAAAESPGELDRCNTAWRLGLAQPGEKQVVHVTEDVVLRLEAKRNRDLYSTDQVRLLPASFQAEGGR